MTIQQDEIRNVSKIFEAFARAITRNENIKIEYLNDDMVSEFGKNGMNKK